MKTARANSQSTRAALKWIKSIVAEPELGEIYEGTVVKVMDFGAFVNFFGNGSRPATSAYGGQLVETASDSHL